MRLFDRYVVVDWSAAARPTTGADSIWVAVANRVGAPTLTNPPTRRLAAKMLAEIADAADGARTLLAVDASLGYPEGGAALCGLGGGPAWRAWWDAIAAAIVDDDRNRNNRFEVAETLNRRVEGAGPFWGRPHTREFEHLAATKPQAFPLSEYRLVELWLRDLGRRPASCWQLLGAGSVGSQTLTLLPVLHGLLERPDVEVWPFTTGLRTPDAAAGVTVIVETWPTAFDPDLSAHAVRDAAQVDAVVRRLREADDGGVLADWFAPELEEGARAAIEREEGWVLVPM
jgi:precorrin-8X/cobalt-precorrin-8 methylmutase